MAKLAPEDRPNRLYALRKAQGLTLQDVAGRTNLSRAHAQKLESGERELTKPVMERFARALGVPEADLLNSADGGLNERERLLIDTYRQVPEGMRAAIDALIDSQQPFRGVPEVVAFPDRRTA